MGKQTPNVKKIGGLASGHSETQLRKFLILLLDGKE